VWNALPVIFVLSIFPVVTVIFPAGTQAEGSKDADKTLSPYFFVKSDDPSLDRMPLKSTSAVVNIAGVIADVTVTQEYKNEGKRPLEAIYIFPASTRAAVYGMKMTIGARTIVAKIDKREQARRSYEQAKQEGKSASLLEQQRPNVFQMSVANIMPGDVIQVELKYTELLVPEDGVYEFVYPTVVGPRYSNQPEATAPQSEKWVANPYLHQGNKPGYTFNMTANLTAGMPIREITSPSHEATVDYDGKSSATVKLPDTEKFGGNRDFILKYRLAGGKVETGMLLYEGKDENYFLMMVQPPERVTAKQIPPREYIFIVDVSGSMNGFPIEVSKSLLRELLRNLRPVDRFNVLLFASRSEVLSSTSLPATEANITAAIRLIDDQRGGGGTEILPALNRALALPRAEEGMSRTVIIATDGYVRVEPEVFDLIRNKLGDANMFAFGIGNSVNRHIIEGMAHVGMGEPFVMTGQSEAGKQAARFREMIASPVLTRVKVDFGSFEVYDVEPPAIPDVLAERPVIVFGKWRGRPGGTIKLSGYTAEGKYMKRLAVNEFKPAGGNSALRYLWARHRITLLADYNNLQNGRNRELVEEVTELGLKYNLLTAYTSFVAIDSEVRNKDGKLASVKQPLPLPEGVSDYALGRALSVQSIQSFTPKQNGETEFFMSAGKAAKLRADAIRLASPASMQIVKIDTDGGLSEQDIKAVFESKKPRLIEIFHRALAKGAIAHGQIVLALEIAPDGRVRNVRIEKRDFTMMAVEVEIFDFVKKMRFPANPQTSKVKITLAFTG
jgi:Ca-activated chloride channel family protein